MTLTARIQLRPTPQQQSALARTLAQGNAACNALSALAFSSKIFSRFALHRLAYRTIREQFGLSSQFTIRCIAKVADAYATQSAQIRRHNAYCTDDQKRTLQQIVCRANGSIAYDARILSLRTDRRTVSLWTIDGRQTIGYVAGEHHDRLLEHQKGESDLVFSNGQWFLLAACDMPEERPIEIEDAIGVDFGIVNLATDSDGQTFSGANVERVRQRYAHRRSVLQSVGTRSAKRRLKKISGRQKRFQRDTNHIIAKTLVEKAKASHRSIVLEDLTGISKRVRRDEQRLGKTQRSRHANWGFFQLRSFISYKAALRGVPVLLVNAAHTSTQCNTCGYRSKSNRRTQACFVCEQCFHEASADINAARNIRDRGICQRAHGSAPFQGAVTSHRL